MSEKRVQCPERLDQDTGHALLESLEAHDLAPDDVLVLDFSAAKVMDSLGGAWIMRAADHARMRGATCRFEGQEGEIAEFLRMMQPALESSGHKAERSGGFMNRVADTVIGVKNEARDFMKLVVEAVYWTLLAPIEGRGFRWNLLVDEIGEMGVRAVRIVAMMNLLLGLTIAMLSAAQLRQVGLDLYVANLVMIGFARELAAIMTAVVVAARTGAAISAELATMQVQEEIDALRGMGLNVSQFLIAPKLLALVIVLPCLTGVGMIMGVIGGTIWGHFVLDFTVDQWMTQTLNAAKLGDIFQGFLKSFFFANIIVLVGCHNGLRVQGGSRGVGLMTTRAVVMDIFMIVVVDMVFAAIFYYVLG